MLRFSKRCCNAYDHMSQTNTSLHSHSHTHTLTPCSTLTNTPRLQTTNKCHACAVPMILHFTEYSGSFFACAFSHISHISRISLSAQSRRDDVNAALLQSADPVMLCLQLIEKLQRQRQHSSVAENLIDHLARVSLQRPVTPHHQEMGTRLRCAIISPGSSLLHTSVHCLLDDN